MFEHVHQCILNSVIEIKNRYGILVLKCLQASSFKICFLNNRLYFSSIVEHGKSEKLSKNKIKTDRFRVASDGHA